MPKIQIKSAPMRHIYYYAANHNMRREVFEVHSLDEGSDQCMGADHNDASDKFPNKEGHRSPANMFSKLNHYLRHSSMLA